ncbi:hypothetical protein SAMN02787118_1206 [Streptomyces mirabilis]|uniref:Uncharacterized protein n=1 Tax=Streptomyces mirabilis TaxID=68239 RepID=A0A1I2RGP4_9ACTN|nr:hypothetical protein SAMN02787118_1206 [Streptomyces mirabilis]
MLGLVGHGCTALTAIENIYDHGGPCSYDVVREISVMDDFLCSSYDTNAND